jgi:hypothetical protein
MATLTGSFWPSALGGHRQLPGFAIQWLFSGGVLEGFNFSAVPNPAGGEE